MSLGSLLRYTGLTLGVLGSFIEHLGHQNRKKDFDDGDMVVYSGTMGDFWGVMWATSEAKEGHATNLQGPAGARRLQVGNKLAQVALKLARVGLKLAASWFQAGLSCSLWC